MSVIVAPTGGELKEEIVKTKQMPANLAAGRRKTVMDVMTDQLKAAMQVKMKDSDDDMSSHHSAEYSD